MLLKKTTVAVVVYEKKIISQTATNYETTGFLLMFIDGPMSYYMGAGYFQKSEPKIAKKLFS